MRNSEPFQHQSSIQVHNCSMPRLFSANPIFNIMEDDARIHPRLTLRFQAGYSAPIIDLDANFF